MYVNKIIIVYNNSIEIFLVASLKAMYDLNQGYVFLLEHTWDL